MDPIERELRRKLGGLRNSQSRCRLGLEVPCTKAASKKYRAKLKEVKQAIKEVESQIESYLKQKKKKIERQLTIKQPGEGRTIAVVGDVYRFLATGEDTNGKYALWEAIVNPGGGPPYISTVGKKKASTSSKARSLCRSAKNGSWRQRECSSICRWGRSTHSRTKRIDQPGC